MKHSVTVAQARVTMGERCTYAHCYQYVENLICKRRHNWLGGGWEEFGKCECFARIATQGGRLIRLKIRKDRFVKSQICPTRKKSEDGKPQGGSR